MNSWNASEQRENADFVADSRWPMRLLPILLVSTYAIIVARRAWVGDDAFITLRTVDNFVNGYGLTWNPAERVQAYTHPLWMFLLSAAYYWTREPVVTTIVVSILVSLTGLLLFVTKGSRSILGAVFGVLILVLSRAFVDYSTSGLENPLSHLLVVVFYALYFGMKPSVRKVFLLSVVASLGAVNRLDLTLLFLPPLVYATLQVRTLQSFAAAVLGQTPLVLWLGFATFYYGFPLPNTAYAKLNTGIPTPDLLEQGLYYFLNSLEYDPITLLTIAATGAIALSLRKMSWIAALGGIALYLAYVARIGGDFMSGRMLTTSLLVAVILLAQLDYEKMPYHLMAFLFGMVLLVGLSTPFPTPANDNRALMNAKELEYMLGDDQGIANERLIYTPGTSLLNLRRGIDLPNHDWARAGREDRSSGRTFAEHKAVGMIGFFAGPGVHILDRLALADPLLARLPAPRQVSWRVGHFDRKVPEGYRESLRSSRNALVDEDLALLYDQILLVTRGSLWDKERLATIVKMNLGRFRGLVDVDAYRYPDLIAVDLAEVSWPTFSGISLEDPRNVQFLDSGLEIRLPELSHAPYLEISLDGRSAGYRILYRNDGVTIADQFVPASYSPLATLDVHDLDVPAEAQDLGYDALRILPESGMDFSLGNARPWGQEEWRLSLGEDEALVLRDIRPYLFGTNLLYVELLWQDSPVISEPGRPFYYTAFVQLLDAQGERRAGSDVLLMRNGEGIRASEIAPVQWVSGYTLELPQGLDPGSYNLLIGLYHFQESELALADSVILEKAVSIEAREPSELRPTDTWEWNVDRAGGDFETLILLEEDPAECAVACQENSNCQAWTYVHPGFGDDRPACYLKDSPGTPLVGQECCVSGRVSYR
jgi:arabinofuranosyltransferase